jgi:chorismate mutase
MTPIEKIDQLREEIDVLDSELLTILKKRFKLVGKIAVQKQKLGIPFYQKKRWHAILEDRVKRGEKYHLHSDFIRALLKLIHTESVRLQRLQNTKGKK